MSKDYGKINLKLHLASMFQREMLQRQAYKEGVYRGQPQILFYISRHEGCTLVELANKAFVTASSVTISIKRLEKNGFVMKKEDQNNLRIKRLYLTEKGHNVIKNFGNDICEIYHEAFKGFSDEEMKNFSDYLDRLIFNITGKKIEDFKEEDFNEKNNEKGE